MDLIDRISEEHKTLLRAMLHTEDVPHAVLVKYFEVKQLVDKVDAFLSPGCLALIILLAKEDPDVTEDLDPCRNAEADEPAEKIDVASFESEVGTGLLKEGTNVQVLINDEIVCGKVLSVDDSDEDPVYQIKTADGETLNVEGREIKEI